MGKAREYELLAKRVMEVLLGLAPDSPMEHDVRVEGRATAHQIDVLWEAPSAFGGPFTVLFECKKHEARIKQKDLLAFRTVIDDIAVVRGETLGVFVVWSGYQSGAVNVASTYGIVILELREPQPNDLRGRITGIDVTLTVQVPVITDWDIVATDADSDKRSARVLTGHRMLLPDGQVTSLGRLVTEGVLDGFDEVPPTRVTKDFASPAILEGTGIRIHSVSATVGAVCTTQTLQTGGAERFSLVLNATIPGASAFLMDDGQMRGDIDALRALVNAPNNSPLQPPPMAEGLS